jgi:hypothetical protein
MTVAVVAAFAFIAGVIVGAVPALLSGFAPIDDDLVAELEELIEWRLRHEANGLPSDFDALIETATRAHPTEWEVGGRAQ